MSRLVSCALLGSLAILFAISFCLSGAEKTPKSHEAAAVAREQVAAALRAEVAGESDRRAELLAGAARTAPDLPEVNWHLSRVQTAGKWYTLDDAQQEAANDSLLTEYRKLRDEAADKIITQAFFTKPEERDEAKLAAARKEVVEEYALFTKAMRGEFLAGPLSAADYALYPLVAFMNRCETKLPDLNANGMLTAELAAWKARIEALPYLASTIPPHWKQ